MQPYADDFTDVAESQAGDVYQWGAETSPTDPDPDSFDCSELVQWSGFRVGVNWVDGSFNQEADCRRRGTMIPVSEAIRTRGALLFIAANGRVHHVAISRGDGTTIEARGKRWGTNVFSAFGRFTSAAKHPLLSYSKRPLHGQPRKLLEEEVMPTFIASPDDPPATGRTEGYRLVRGLRCILAVNGAPIAKKTPDKDGRSVVVLPAKYGEIIDMDMNSDRTGIVVLFADDGTVDIPFRGSVHL